MLPVQSRIGRTSVQDVGDAHVVRYSQRFSG
jgi:hypothetical protein